MGKTNNFIIRKILLSFFVLGFITWFGGAASRSAIAYDLFKPTQDMQIKTNYSDEVKYHTVYLFSVTAVYTTVGYLIAFAAAIGLIIAYRKELKSRGWLFMSFILFFIASPMELYLIYKDIQLSLAVFYDKEMHFTYYKTQEFFTNRYTNVTITTASGLSVLSIITAVLFIIWRPLNLKAKQNEDVYEGERALS